MAGVVGGPLQSTIWTKLITTPGAAISHKLSGIKYVISPYKIRRKRRTRYTDAGMGENFGTVLGKIWKQLPFLPRPSPQKDLRVWIFSSKPRWLIATRLLGIGIRVILKKSPKLIVLEYWNKKLFLLKYFARDH